jgi:scavenger receptor class B protein 1
MLTTKGWYFMVLGLFLIFLGIGFTFLVPITWLALFREYSLKIRMNSTGAENWATTPRLVTVSVYIFNLTNPNLVMRGEKPIFVESGPYVYELKKTKENITFTGKNRVSFFKTYRYTFRRDASIGNESDVVMTPNPVLFSQLIAEEQTQRQPYLIAAINTLYANHQTKGIFETRSIRNILIGEDEKDNKFFQKLQKDYSINSHVPKLLIPNHNETSARFTVFTGRNDINNLNTIDRYNLRSDLNYWKGSECNNMSRVVSDDDIRPKIDNDKKAQIIWSLEFETWIQKWKLRNPSVLFEMGGYYHVYGKEYCWDPDTFNNSETVPEHYCYDSSLRSPLGYKSLILKTGLPSGVRDISKKYTFSVIMSLPHFLYADPYFGKSMEGMSPSIQKHSSSWLIEPKTGITLNKTMRYQINMPLSHSVTMISGANKVRPIIYPVLWIEMERIIPKDLMKNLDSAITQSWLMSLIIGPFTCLIGLGFFVKGFLLRKKVAILAQPGIPLEPLGSHIEGENALHAEMQVNY